MSRFTFMKPLALIGAAVLLSFYSTGTSAQVVADDVVCNPAGCVDASDLAGASVLSAKLRNSAVTTSKIANGAVTGSNLANGTVTSSKIAPAAVGTGLISPDLAPLQLS